MKEIILAVTLSFILTVYAGPLQKCEAIDEDVICQCRGYNLTYFPNDRFSSQSGAKIQFSQFENLIRTNCSPYLVQFLCSRYFPPCSPDWRRFDYVLPCRELCEKVKRDCEAILHQYGTQWSKELSCDAFQSINGTQPNSPPCIGVQTIVTANSDAKCKNREKCIHIEHSKGKSAKYKTFFPNAVTSSQKDASQKLDRLLKKRCSLEAEQFFILSHYPPCTEVNNTAHLIYPCKQLCRRINKGCEGQLGGKGKWPEYMDCRKLSKEGCVNDVSRYFAKPSPTTSTSIAAKTSIPLPVSTPTAKPLKPCKHFIETSCSELNNFSDLPNIRFPVYSRKFTKYVKLLDSKCSVWLKPFLCYETFSAYKSTKSAERIRPCRNVCRKAENECSDCFAKLGITWSNHWNCQDFQVKKDCIGMNELQSYSSSNNNKVGSSCPINKDKVCTP